MELVLKKKEGDLITPKGIFKVVKIFYRSDKLKKSGQGFPLLKYKKNTSGALIREVTIITLY